MQMTQEHRLLEDSRERNSVAMEMRSIASRQKAHTMSEGEDQRQIYGRYQEELLIVAFVISRALFCDLFYFLFFVLFDLFGVDSSFLVLVGEDKG